METNKQLKVLHIMRGVPGSGKSTFVEKNIKVDPENYHSTDCVIEDVIAPETVGYGGIEGYRAFFKHINDTKDFKKFSKAHNINFKNAQKSMDNGVLTVVIDNTNLHPSEAKKYVEYGLKCGYKIQINTVDCGKLTAMDLAERNVHGVPVDAIEKMMNKLNSFPTLTTEQIMKAKDR